MGHLSLTNAETVQLTGSLALLFLSAHLLGALARRLGQPSIVGFLLAGVVLGRSGLGAAWPSLAAFLLPPAGRSHLLGAVVELSLLMVLIVLGAETDVRLVRRLGQRSVGVIAGGIVVPLLAGSVAAYVFAGSLVSGNHLAGAVLIGGALGVSSLPVIARLVAELRIARRDVGQLALATAVVNDVYGLLLLAAVSAAVSAEGASALARPVAGLVVVAAALAVFGQRLVDFLFRTVRHEGPNATGAVAVAVTVPLGVAAALQAAGIEAALGAFVVGVLMARSRFQDGEAIARLRSFSDAVFAPLYFASAGLLVNLSALSSWHRVLVVAVLLVVAVVSKALGTRVGAVRARLRRGENAALMILLNGRGALQVIIATAGLRMGLLSNFAYTSILLVSVVSSLLVAPALRRLAGEWEGSEDERLRLAYEDRIDHSVLVREQRLLVPMLDGSNPQLAAALFDHAWPAAAEITLLGAPPGEDVAPLPDVARAVRRRTAASHNLVDAAFEEARLGYGAFGVGVSSAAPRLPPDVIELLNGSPLPVVLVRPAVDDGGQLGPLRHVAVATTGTTAGIAGEELAAGLARRHNARLHVVHVVPDLARRARRPGLPGAFDGVLAEAVARVRRAGLRPSAASVRSASVGRALLDHAAASGIDLLVVGARLRRVGDVPFLGYAVSELLDAPDPLTLVVVALPDAPPTELDQPFVERSMV